MQVRSLDELDRKASASLQAGSLVLPVVFGLVGVSGRTPPVAANVLLVAALVAFVGLVCCYLGATARRKVNYRPDPAGMGENGALSDSAHARRWLGREYCMATVENNSWLRRNACWTRWTNWLLVAECLAIVLAAAFTLRW